MTLRALDVSWDRGGAMVLDGVSVEPETGETVGLLGPNGSGKSSLLRLLAGFDRPSAGAVRLGDTDLRGVRRREIARSLAVVAQESGTDVAIRVRDVVALGRLPHRGPLGPDHASDRAAVDRALTHAGLVDKADRLWHQLSGGERQRVQIARALAQEPTHLLLDEPTNHLDIRHQLDLLDLVARLPVTAVVALHDLNLAAMFCDHIVVLRAGRVVAAGRPAEVLTSDLIADVYEVTADVVVEADGTVTVRYGRTRLSTGR
ncbi:ABC transporter ATP-binding protein [Williamsia deligens]|uniref:ABC transporter ATP-binding protein n=1 Tax=Williamsia deligens TaxID=321325 RepID=A0ABW3GH41_9NOCA|nr:ABC transporter ATP-binding protein [Williamsia deligens]MCP2195486.1 iron complex transport system ATP-binding protein [Williamsia deligens]